MMEAKIKELQLDIAELKSLQENATRNKVKAELLLDFWNITDLLDFRIYFRRMGDFFG